jgi:type II secretion system protein J
MNTQRQDLSPTLCNRFAARKAPALPASADAFTLIEVLLSLGILAMLLVVVHTLFQGALQLRNKTDQAFEDALPLQHALWVIQRDLEHLTVPGGTFHGPLQTTLTTGSSTATSISHPGRQCGPILYTASGTLDDKSPWSIMRKVSYYLVPSTNGSAGLDLIRSATRNLLPVAQEEYTDQRLMGGVTDLAFQFYNGTQWVDTWDSTATTTGASNSLPSGIRVQLTLSEGAGSAAAQPPIELIVPVVVGASTNSSAASTGGGG